MRCRRLASLEQRLDGTRGAALGRLALRLGDETMGILMKPLEDLFESGERRDLPVAFGDAQHRAPENAQIGRFGRSHIVSHRIAIGIGAEDVDDGLGRRGARLGGTADGVRCLGGRSLSP